MKKKIIGILVCILLITVTVLPVTGTINDNTDYKKESDKYDNLIKQGIENGVISKDNWWEQDKLLASDGAIEDYFGYSVSISGDYAIVGADGNDDNGYHSGSAYVFKRDGTSWTEEAKLLASDGAANDWFGESVSIDGDYAIIGAPYDEDNGHQSGSAYVFTRSGTVWTEEAKLLASDGAENDCFGGSVSISGDYTIVSALGDDDNGDMSGSAYVFTRSGTVWTEEAKLLASDGAEYDWFGGSVSIDGDYAIIGAHRHYSAGSAYVFKRDGTSWTEEAKLLASDATGDDWFGCSVSIDGDYAIVGAINDDYNGYHSGSAYVFTRSGTTWTEQQKFLASDGAEYDWFGYSVSIDGDYAIIGAHQDDDNGDLSGSAYVFIRSGTVWTEEAKLLASDGTFSDYFGFSVSIDGDYAIIGAWGDNDYGDWSGSAYIFKRPVPDLECLGSFSWRAKKGTTITDEFTLANSGDPGSELSWEIESYPEWGTWTIIPSSGTGLTPETGLITINVEVIAPDELWQRFTGDIKVINSENTDDFDLIPVTLWITLSDNHMQINPYLLKILERFPNAFPIFRHLLDL